MINTKILKEKKSLTNQEFNPQVNGKPKIMMIFKDQTYKSILIKNKSKIIK